MKLDVTISEKDLKEIIKYVRSQRGIDLSYFKPAFLTRRINVRMLMLNINSGSEYSTLLNSDPNEIGALYDSLSINVTKFYRDKQVWQTFSKKVIPDLLNLVNTTETIRIWSCGCASGEEPYSLAIMFSEALKNTKRKFKILATDINSHALKIAREGKYSFENLRNLDSMTISKYFEKLDYNQYKISEEIKNLVSFNLGDITKFPASYLDVVFCRNLLIYYGIDAQDLIFKKFLTVLKDNRYLVLGMDETLWGHKFQNLFIPVSPRERIYKKTSGNQFSTNNSINNIKINNERMSSTDSLSNFISGRTT